MKVEIYKRTDGLWDWRLKADNGQVIAGSQGQGYTERNDAHEGWDRVVGLMDDPNEPFEIEEVGE